MVAHSDAVPARCAHYAQGCGGCAMQDLAYPAQLKAKQRQVLTQTPRPHVITQNPRCGCVHPLLRQ